MILAGKHSPAARDGALPVGGINLCQGAQGALQVFEGILADPLHHRVQRDAAGSQQAAQIRVGDGRQPLTEQAEVRFSETFGPGFGEVLAEKPAFGLPCGSHGGTG